MASLQSRLSDLITQFGTDYKMIMSKLSGNNTGDLSSLTTTAKTSLVAAINEVKSGLASAAGIDDTATSASTTKTYSANKITSVVNSAVTAVIGGAGAAYDTLLELQTAIQTDDSAISGILTSLTKRIRVDAAQTFTGTELTQGQDNLSVYSRTQLGDPNTDLVALYTTAKS